MPNQSPDQFALSGRFVDLSQRVAQSSTVVASPALAAETIIASVTITSGLTLATGVILWGWAAYTVGTSGTTVQFRIRQTSVAGTVVGNTGALSGSQHGAGILSADDVGGFDASAGDGQVYKLTMQVANGAAASTVSAVQLIAFAV